MVLVPIRGMALDPVVAEAGSTGTPEPGPVAGRPSGFSGVVAGVPGAAGVTAGAAGATTGSPGARSGRPKDELVEREKNEELVARPMALVGRGTVGTAGGGGTWAEAVMAPATSRHPMNWFKEVFIFWSGPEPGSERSS